MRALMTGVGGRDDRQHSRRDRCPPWARAALRYGAIAIGGFLGYAFGNTIGVSIVSGGAVRYRIYSAVGLNAFEVAAISGYIAVAQGTGLTIVGVAARAASPASRRFPTSMKSFDHL